MNYFDIKPTRSRNWEIEEEEEDIRDESCLSQPRMTVCIDRHRKLHFTISTYSFIYIVATKDAPCIFLRAAYAGQLDEIAEISLEGINSVRTNEQILNNRCQVYRHKTDQSIIFILCQFTVPVDRSFTFAKLIMSTFNNPQRVLVIDSLIDTQFLAEDYRHPVPPFIRTLRTSVTKPLAQFMALETPNLVQRLPAALMSHVRLIVIMVTIRHDIDIALLSLVPGIWNSCPLF
ncbi:hypothetical protein SAMD00019534_088320, partial [Acytostelium subglobosum LB1]|uniref:hypothetical protein n=1 Tax=Acytostelium subglobosum LB1 TaxID=1410327 RepID=UPI000644A8C7